MSIRVFLADHQIAWSLKVGVFTSTFFFAFLCGWAEWELYVKGLLMLIRAVVVFLIIALFFAIRLY